VVTKICGSPPGNLASALENATTVKPREYPTTGAPVASSARTCNGTGNVVLMLVLCPLPARIVIVLGGPGVSTSVGVADGPNVGVTTRVDVRIGVSVAVLLAVGAGVSVAVGGFVAVAGIAVVGTAVGGAVLVGALSGTDVLVGSSTIVDDALIVAVAAMVSVGEPAAAAVGGGVTGTVAMDVPTPGVPAPGVV